MTETVRLGLPLVQAAQAQKHVTVNEALGRLDGLCQLVLDGRDWTEPPVDPEDGAVFAIGPGASGEWSGREGRLALYLNGGWVFVTPRSGWRAWDDVLGVATVHDGVDWVIGGVAVSPNGAATVAEVVEADVEVVSGSYVDSAAIIPSGCVVQAVTARVVEEVTGPTSWRMGVADSDDRYGTGYGTGGGSWARGVTGQPQAYYSDTSLRITAEDGSFAGGRIRIAVHVNRFTLPRV